MRNRKLSIIIPHYGEAAADFFPVLSLLNAQLGVDFEEIECIIVNEGKCPEEFADIFKNLNLRPIAAGKSKSPGMVRQAGLDAASGEYILFCETDTYPANVLALTGFMDEIRNNHPQLIISPWLEERYDSAESIRSYIQHDTDFAYLHGKAFERTFLLQKNIRFHENLKIYESNYFVSLAILEAQTVRNLPVATFVWKYHKDGAPRTNDIDKTMPDYIKSIGYVLAETQKRRPDQMYGSVCQCLLDLYFLLNRRTWQMEENQTLLKKAEDAFGEMIRPYLPYYENTPQELFTDMYNKVRAASFHGEIEKERFSAWLSRVTRPRVKGAR